MLTTLIVLALSTAPSMAASMEDSVRGGLDRIHETDHSTGNQRTNAMKSNVAKGAKVDAGSTLRAKSERVGKHRFQQKHPASKDAVVSPKK